MLKEVLRVHEFKIIKAVRGKVKVVISVLCLGVIVGHSASVLGETDIWVAQEVIFIVQHWPFTPDKQDSLAVWEHAHLIGSEKLTAGVLVVYAEAAASAFTVTIGVYVQSLPAHEFGDVFVCLL